MAEKIGGILWTIAERISVAKAYLLGNGMNKVLEKALDLFEKLPEEKRTPEVLTSLLDMGIEKEHKGAKLWIQLKKKRTEKSLTKN